MGISIIIFAIILLFNSSLQSILDETCSHGPECSMHETFTLQKNISIVIASLVLLIGLFLIFSKESEKIIIQKVKEREKKKKINLEGLDKEEKEVIQIITNESGAIFQATLMEKLNIGKVKMTRLIDKLESKQLVERKRRGMNNIIVLKR